MARCKNRQKSYPYLFLALVTVLACVLLTAPVGIFGSGVDWISQHSVLPEYFRRQFYETGQLFPDFAPNIGGGQNIYHFSYYGLYSPIVFFSYLLPFVKMEVYLMVVSILGVAAAVCLFYGWLIQRGFSVRISLLTALLLLAAAPMIYQSYSQIMFVNYMPFLVLSFWGVDRYFERGKSGLLTVGIFLMILTSFYFSIGGMLALVLYGVHRYLRHSYDAGARVTVKGFLGDGIRFLLPFLTAVWMSGILLIPTAMTLGGGREGQGSLALAELLLPDLTLTRFLYSPYGIGLTSLVITVLLTGLSYRKACERVLTWGCAVFLACPIFTWLLNGGLYIRDKVWIPFLPLLCYLIAGYLQRQEEKELSFWQSVLPYCGTVLLVCLHLDAADVQAHKEWSGYAFAVETVLLLLFFLLYWKWRKTVLLVMPSLIFLLGASILINTVYGKETDRELYEAVTDVKIREAVQEVVKEDDGYYRIEQYGDTEGNAANLNRIWSGRQYSSSIYSSAYQKDYQTFRQKLFRVEQPFRNSMMQSASANPLFRQMMGVKYILSKEAVPGYELYRQEGELRIYKNEHTAPIAYVTDQTISEETYESLSFPYNQLVFGSSSVVAGAEQKKLTESELKEQYPLCRETAPTSYRVRSEKKQKLSIALQKAAGKDTIAFLQFKVKNHRPSQDVAVWFEGIRNKLTARSHFYYNDNTTFTYAAALAEGQDTLDLALGAGEYDLEAIVCYTGEMPEVTYDSPFRVDWVRTEGNRIAGTVEVQTDGSFITSIPYDENFQILVDGKEVSGERVNLAFLGFPVEKGSHKVELTYHAPGKRAGIACSLVGILLFVILGALQKRRTSI